MAGKYCPYCGNELQFREAEICPKCGMRISEPSKASPTPVLPDTPLTVSYSYVGFWTRFGAYLIDAVIMIIISICVVILIIASFRNLELFTTTEYSTLTPAGIMLYILLFILFWVYFTVQECSSVQATLGKRAVKIKVIDNAGNRIGFGQAAIRNFLKVIPLVNLICFIVIGFSEKKQGLHDMAAGTYVYPK